MLTTIFAPVFELLGFVLTTVGIAGFVYAFFLILTAHIDAYLRN